MYASIGTRTVEGPVLRRPTTRGGSKKPVIGAEMNMKAFQKVFMYLGMPRKLIRVLSPDMTVFSSVYQVLDYAGEAFLSTIFVSVVFSVLVEYLSFYRSCL